jgi:selenocysteine lyase/cysteine desulfurase
MVMQLKKAVGEKFILSREHELMKKARKKLSNLDNFVLLGNAFVDDDVQRHLPVLSFVVKSPTLGGFLHHNFVCALLNDLFGIQARGGNYSLTVSCFNS